MCRSTSRLQYVDLKSRCRATILSCPFFSFGYPMASKHLHVIRGLMKVPKRLRIHLAHTVLFFIMCVVSDVRLQGRGNLVLWLCHSNKLSLPCVFTVVLCLDKTDCMGYQSFGETFYTSCPSSAFPSLHGSASNCRRYVENIRSNCTLFYSCSTSKGTVNMCGCAHGKEGNCKRQVLCFFIVELFTFDKCP